MSNQFQDVNSLQTVFKDSVLTKPLNLKNAIEPESCKTRIA